MQRLPELIAAPLGDRIALDTDVMRVDGTTVHHAHGRVHARAVVVATDPAGAAALVPGLDVPEMNGVTTLYHLAEDAPRSDGLLLVDGEQELVSSTVVLSNVAPEYAPAGRALISTSVLGAGHDPAELDGAVRRRLSDLYATSTARWEPIAAYPIRGAVPRMDPPLILERPVRLGDGRYVAGDHRATSSIQGALSSGRRAARAVLDDLGVLGRTPTPSRVGAAARG
jgi:hypothetical protein